MMYGNGLPKEYSGLRIQINENTKQHAQGTRYVSKNKQHSIEGHYSATEDGSSNQGSRSVPMFSKKGSKYPRGTNPL